MGELLEKAGELGEAGEASRSDPWRKSDGCPRMWEAAERSFIAAALGSRERLRGVGSSAELTS